MLSITKGKKRFQRRYDDYAGCDFLGRIREQKKHIR